MPAGAGRGAGTCLPPTERWPTAALRGPWLPVAESSRQPYEGGHGQRAQVDREDVQSEHRRRPTDSTSWPPSGAAIDLPKHTLPRWSLRVGGSNGLVIAVTYGEEARSRRATLSRDAGAAWAPFLSVDLVNDSTLPP